MHNDAYMRAREWDRVRDGEEMRRYKKYAHQRFTFLIAGSLNIRFLTSIISTLFCNIFSSFSAITLILDKNQLIAT